mmetsp:Transcript_17605/g.36745  ORF Transcript_17605/g.36745 Transcript_17605/m.36745 type:complete len:80 (+) Transcript_17605:187-426(+)
MQKPYGYAMQYRQINERMNDDNHFLPPLPPINAETAATVTAPTAIPAMEDCKINFCFCCSSNARSSSSFRLAVAVASSS